VARRSIPPSRRGDCCDVWILGTNVSVFRPSSKFSARISLGKLYHSIVRLASYSRISSPACFVPCDTSCGSLPQHVHAVTHHWRLRVQLATNETPFVLPQTCACSERHRQSRTTTTARRRDFFKQSVHLFVASLRRCVVASLRRFVASSLCCCRFKHSDGGSDH